MSMTESPDLVRRRGRWQAMRTCEIYLQEISAATGLARLPESTVQKIQALAAVFPSVVERCCFFMACQIPFKAWYILFTTTKEAG